MRSISAGEDRRVALLREFERSGLSMAEFCRRREVGYSTMAARRRSLRERTGAFVEVEPLERGAPPAGRSTGSLCAELMLPGGAVLRGLSDQPNRRKGMIFTRGLRVCRAAQPADLRRSFEGLALLVRGALKEDERSSQIFVFTNRRRDRIRLLYWDGTDVWLLTKKLEAGNFSWPKVPDGAAKIALRAEALEMLLSGLDLKGVRMRPWYEDPSEAAPAAGGS